MLSCQVRPPTEDIDNHQDKPYTNRDEKIALAKESDLTLKQVKKQFLLIFFGLLLIVFYIRSIVGYPTNGRRWSHQGVLLKENYCQLPSSKNGMKITVIIPIRP